MRKLAGLLTILCLSFILLGSQNAYADDNLLINGSGENGMEGWLETDDSKGVWMPDTATTSHSAKDGKTFFWPSLQDCVYACMYQDVDISDIAAGTWMSLSAWLANYDQNPHDRATLKIQILDSKNQVLYEDYSLQRNPEWQLHEMNFTVPAKAKTARVLCIADRFVGKDNDAYFDDIRLTLTDTTVSPVIISGNSSTAKPGDTIQLSASDGKYKKASYYEWSSSYDRIATVDENGLVTLAENPEESLVGAEVWIFARNKKTGVIGKYYVNSDRKNTKETAESGTSSDKSSKVDKVKALSVVSVKLSWTKSGNANGYYVYRYDDAAGKYVKIATIKKAATTSYTAKDLELNKEYRFKIVAYATKNGKKVKSGDSNIVTVSLK